MFNVLHDTIGGHFGDKCSRQSISLVLTSDNQTHHNQKCRQKHQKKPSLKLALFSLVTSSSCNCELWCVTLTFKHDLDSVKMNQRDTFFESPNNPVTSSTWKTRMIPLEFPNVLWCADIQDVGLFSHKQIFPASPSLYSQYSSITDNILWHEHAIWHANKTD